MAIADAVLDAAEAEGRKRLDAWARRFCEAAAAGSGMEALLCDDCVWRDLLLLTWDLRTVEGPAAAPALAAGLAASGPVQLSELHAGALRGPGAIGFVDVDAEAGTVGGWFEVETRAARGAARVTLRAASGEGGDRCAVLFTSMRELKGHEEPTGARRPLGHELRAVPRSESGKASPGANGADEPYVLVVGGSQSGLMIGARLKRMGVPSLVVERHALPGDTWRNRYGSLHLHDPIFVCDLPYLKMPEHWPVYVSKDQFADWMDLYAKTMDIDFQGKTEVVKASFDCESRRWTVELCVGGSDRRTVRPAHLVMAVGNLGAANVPQLPGLESFEGESLHSSQFRGCVGPDHAKWRGRRCVVVGSNTSAHDVAQDLYEHGAEVTMLQRSATCVLPTLRVREMCASAGYSEEAVARGVDAAQADLAGAAEPYSLRLEGEKRWVEELKVRDAEYYARLEKVGWRQTWGEDETGSYMMFLRTFRGFYFDIGASELIMDGKIKLESGASVAEVRPRSVLLSSGKEIPCDVLVLATGYKNMTEVVAKMISPAVAEAVGPCWGLGSGTSGDPGPWVGEMRNMWKPTAQPGLWFQGGNIMMSRFHSLHLALQLKARFEGIVTEPVTFPPRRATHAASERGQ